MNTTLCLPSSDGYSLAVARASVHMNSAKRGCRIADTQMRHASVSDSHQGKNWKREKKIGGEEERNACEEGKRKKRNSQIEDIKRQHCYVQHTHTKKIG